ncbi:MAG: AAA family ATPase [Ignavibacteria bacterium CG_4_8_14_3_um_filter_37_9]|nr:AAA domain-containing protein [Ignavibacteria bacterium]OIO22633.1 MAG: AAA family ATPase [Ignavibacteria bacterium CG1_02_37_35]PIP78913.1 MAG: AAA family ATPase [Ignavibacteria bacterium CG22_combo_CG10-13_8_21_14_all_37_15]PIS43930.1 MAG: AAA family ATPase [Ignavibacteria bacterium CG08_land_8_20_14_0_20_37_9]PIW99130.1 MAG: AAA family ATPase [Ignavibacteria bacterium CG_4_8_14_3_um_filter_37_9]PIX94581.1 MAG: AAA family ATPase [Ignavibacteria bacterium CG_4_10_14_3_um_filter_37_18]PJC6
MQHENQYNDVQLVEQLAGSVQSIKKEIAKVIIGQVEVIDHLLLSLLSRGHCLLVGVPGLAKTLIIKTLADVLDLKFNRIQFTPDLMPSDITGTEILEEDSITKKREFRFILGPIFANVILADEINRTPPKTQAALLEAMQEHKVTIAGKTYPLDEPFFVLATQNPIEQEGTYPLPEAQLDRFMFNLWLDYPSLEEEKEIVKTTTGGFFPELNKIVSAETLVSFQQLVRRVPVSENVISFAVNFVNKTRPNNGQAPPFIKEWLRWGAGPRASQYLILAAKAKAVCDGRFTPKIDDVKSVLIPVLRHRIITNFNAEAEGINSVEVIKKIIEI